MVIDVLHHLYKVGIARACVFTDTKHRSIYFNHTPDGLIYDSNNSNDSKNIIKRLEKLCYLQKQLFMMKELGHVPENLNLDLVIVLDACVDRKTLSSCIMRTLFIDGRCWGIKMIVTVKHNILLPPTIIGNCDQFIKFAEDNSTLVKSIYSELFGVFEKCSHFRNCLRIVTQDFTGLILDRTCFGSDVDSCVKFYKAKQGRQFMFGIDDGDWSRRRCLVLPRNMQIPQIGILGLNEDIFREIVGYL